MKRNKFLYAIPGVGFLLIGIGTTVILIMYVAGLGNPNPQIPIVVVGLVIPLMSIFFIGLGIVDLHSFPHAVTWDNNGLAMSFLFRKEQVSWEDVEWYNNIIICGIDFSGSYHIWILLKYYSIRNGSVCARKAIFFLPSVGSTMSWSAKDFLTVLDQYIPNKKVLKNKKW